MQIKFIVTVLPDLKRGPPHGPHSVHHGGLSRRQLRIYDTVPTGFLTRIDVDKLFEVLRSVDEHFAE